MEPEVLETPESSLNSYGRIYNQANPEDDAWIKEQKRSDTVCAVGFLAKKLHAKVRMNSLKYESAVHKVMAALGSIITKNFASTDEKFSVSVFALLPHGEYSNHGQLREQLEKSLKRFYFRGTRIQIALENFVCFPEGGGLACSLSEDKGENWFQSKNIAVLVFGHRNVSLLFFQRGAIQYGKTTDLGFYQILDRVIKNTSGQDRNSLAKKVFKVDEETKPSSGVIASLVRSEEPKNKKVESKQILNSINSARQECWNLTENWLKGTLDKRNQIDQLVVCGGTARYLEDEITSFFEGLSIYWGNKIQKEIKQRLKDEFDQSAHVSKEEDRNILAFRLIDVYCLSCRYFSLSSPN